MFTFDAFSFTQVPFIFWILLGLSAAFLRISGAAAGVERSGVHRLPGRWSR
jgi:hypothetical protein